VVACASSAMVHLRCNNGAAPHVGIYESTEFAPEAWQHERIEASLVGVPLMMCVAVMRMQHMISKCAPDNIIIVNPPLAMQCKKILMTLELAVGKSNRFIMVFGGWSMASRSPCGCGQLHFHGHPFGQSLEVQF
jgi:hypothetical protein